MSTAQVNSGGTRGPVAHADAAAGEHTVMVIVRPRTPIPPELQPLTHLTREAFLARHGANAEDLQTVAQCAGEHGIQVSMSDENRRMVLLKGPGKSFREMFEYQAHASPVPDTDVGPSYASTGVPRMPERLRGVVAHVIGLPEELVSGLFVTMKPAMNVSTSLGDANGYGLPSGTPRRKLGTLDELEAFYSFPAGSGAGQTIGIIEMGGGYRREDVDAFLAACGVRPAGSLTDVSVSDPGSTAKPVNQQLTGDDLEILRQFALWMKGEGPLNEFGKPYFEATMDVSLIAALLPEADVQVYFGNSEIHAFANLLQEALFVHEPQPTVLSISWSFQERWVRQYPSDIAAAHFINDLFLAAAHMGVTVCCSSGDWGASNRVNKGLRGQGYDINFPSSSPYVLACGGTSILGNGDEVVWNADFPKDQDDRESKHGASGGGYSRLFAQPPWQVGVTDADNPNKGEPVTRGTPDVAAVADPHCGVDCRLAGESFPSAGTSAAAPIWAALVARLNENLGRRIGCLNPLLYAQVGHLDGVLKDVTEGDNLFAADDVGFKARAGWNPCTGLGTPNGEGLLQFLRARLPPS